ncbi:SDR family NAD(P)-dependent oxidoreductase [Dendrosporobacter quercicolus]|uniref:SDR family NAD(P)-dependent oxidoreductase n=1 Tax=Dendrosporobacter quercicolus TaxID=146817 RepID=UPI001C312C55|nr:SDR family NAD(P)-dependent oxidoreductase [Dendrosporobacter quercicolus]
MIQIIVFSQDEEQLFSGLAGLLKTAQLEHPRLVGQLIEVEPEETAEGIVAKLRTDRRSAIDSHIRYQDNKRWVAGWSEVKTSPENVGLPWKEQGVYLITGGAGGLGLIFAREITQRVKNATLILTGRSVLTENKQAQLRELEVLGAKVVYRQVDVTQAKAVAELIQNIRAEFGTIHGVIHSAGVIRDNLIIKKHKEEMQEVLAPKVTGLVNLDQATKALPLDFFILFSSVTGAFGNIGQCDYAVGNAFMDTYVKYRNVLADSGQRRGQTLSINWPLWKEGGMRIDAVAAKRMRQSMGLVAMQTATGIKALYQGLALGCGQAAVMEGDLKRIREVFLGEVINTDTTESLCTNESKDVTAIGENWLREKVVDFLKQLISAVIKLPADRLEEDAPMEKYGIDSIMIMQLTDRLEKTFGTLEKTLFFEYQSIQELSVYFLESYREQLLRLFATESEVAATMNDHRRFAAETEPVKKSLSSRRRSGIASFRTESREEKAMGALDIAIIGVAGRYPQAGNMKEFWENLRDGRDCITEIPSSRWEYGRYYTQEKDSIGTMYSKWGGFLADIDKFDSLLFNIAPLDAPRIDPQERLFLETVWETMEDAGYTRTGLGKHAKVGVFVGVMWGEYQLLGGGGIREAFAPPTASFASIANRVSYFYNFHGPSIALDTMCSSSLTAIHLACHSIQRGDCEMAIAGGVNLSLHPNKYIQLSQNRFLSSDGRCRSFGEGGDGYVPGEGVGAVLLKPLAKAVADQDQIYAVIKDVSINHGGKSNGYSVPNLNAQAELIDESLQKAQVDPRTITYIEAQGTGTSLGDPIEIGGLTKAYRNFTQDKQYCLVGSVKSNIGHLEAAAGIAALTKTLLQFKYKQIVPSLHSAKLNPNINFDHSPFYVQQKLSEWNSLVVNRNGISSPLPRRAAVNAFGAGGANAHMILEEYQSIPKAENQLPALSQIMVLSARTKNCLYEYAKRLCNFCSNASDQEAELDIADMVYTLHVGRESMQERLAIIGATLADFIAGLTSFLQRPEDLADQNTIFYGCATGASQLLHKEAPGDRLLHRLVEQRDLIELGKLWVDGAAVPWEKLYDGKAVRRISLPTYPFERKAYWILENNHHSMPAAESLRLPSTPGNNRLGQLPILNNFEEPVKDLELESDVVRRSYGDEVVPKRVIPAEYSVAVRMDTGYDDVENLISHIVVQNLGMEQNELNIDIDLGIYGLDSFTRIRIINDIQREFGDIVVSPEVIFEQNTVKKLAKYIEGEIKQGYPAISKAKARDESIIGNEHNVISPGMKDGRRLNSVKSQYPLLPNDTFGLKTNNILLNGVTGVLGSRLVCEYLERTDSMLFCLVRAKNTGQAKQRIRAMLEVYDPELSLLSEFDRRVIPVLGDITKPYLGMEPESYEELASRIDMVVHSAAKKSLHGVYSEVKAVNVDGTQNMVDFALRTKQKYFIHISTVYAIMGECKEKEGRTFKESDFELEQKFGNLGYSRSKFEAEKIVRSTQDLKWIIMRSGYIMGDSHKGYYPLNMTGIPDVFYDFIKTTIELEMAVNSPWYWDITPVDYISRSIVWLSTSLKDIKQTYHLSNPDYKTSKDIAAIISKLGYPIKFVSEEEYKNFLRRKGNRYRSIITELILFNPALIQNSYADTTYTTKILAQAGIYCPEIDEKLIATYLDYCIKVGYLKDIRQRDFESQQVQLPKSNTR